MLPVSAQLKDFWFRRLASLQDNLCMVDHVKFVMHFKVFMACCNIIIGGWVPLQNIGARAGGPQDWLMYTRHRTSQRSTDTSDRIHDSLLQCYYLPVNVRCLRDSLSVIDGGSHSGTLFEAPFVDFLRAKILHRIFSGDISRKMACSKFWPHVIRGPLSSRGPYARAYRA